MEIQQYNDANGGSVTISRSSIHRKESVMRKIIVVTLAAMMITATTQADAAMSQTRTAVTQSCVPSILKKYLKLVDQKYGKVIVLSTFRKGAVIAGTRKPSKHAKCQAVDFRVARNQAAAAKWLKTQPIEVITYSGSLSHIHIATGSFKGHHHVGKGKSKLVNKGRNRSK